jgi:uncharacterized protein
MRNLLWIIIPIIGFSHALSAQKDNDDISIGKYRLIHSTILNEDRTLLVSLPRDYDKTEKAFPVLYMLYGDHINTYFAETVSVLNKYSADASIPAFILVGIMNTDRYRDLIPLDQKGNKTGIDNFLSFLKDELVPFVEKNYRTKPYRALLAPQAGANFALYTLFKEPGLFRAFFLNNPFRWNSGRELMLSMAQEYLAKNKVLDNYIFITHDQNDQLEREGNEFIEKFSGLVEKYKPADFVLVKNYLPDNKDFISPTGIKEGITSCFSEYPLPENQTVACLEDIKNHYAGLSKKYGYDIDIPGHVLVMKADELAAKGKTAEYTEILCYMIETNTDQSNAYWRLADMSYRAGRMEEAKEYLAKMMELMGSDAGIVKNRYKQIDRMIRESASWAIESEINRKGFKAGKQKYAGLLKSQDKYFDERELNAAGYRFLQREMVNEAIFIFEINVYKYPGSANAYDSYAEALLKKGKKAEAIKNYKKSLELNPGNENAREMIEKLEKN